MKWVFAALAFACTVALAIATTAIKAENVRARRQIERVVEQMTALEATFELEQLQWRRAVDPRRLVQMWGRLVERSAE